MGKGGFIILSQWFLNPLSNQVWASLPAQVWFDRRFKNHWLPTRVAGTHFYRKDERKTTVHISKWSVDLDLNQTFPMTGHICKAKEKYHSGCDGQHMLTHGLRYTR